MSGLGLDAQRESVARYLNGGDWELVGEFTETETGKGADALAKRPQLRAALQACRESGARLLIAKLDRLGLQRALVSGPMESKVQFVAVRCRCQRIDRAHQGRVRGTRSEADQRADKGRTSGGEGAV
jgi:DNA invertase Pin-like site-specific DNA recombinase